PVMHDTRLLISSFYNGSMLLDVSKPQASKLWQGKSDSEINTGGLHAIIATPVFDGDDIYGVRSYGQFRCLRASTGERVWKTLGERIEGSSGASTSIPRVPGYLLPRPRSSHIVVR